MHHKDVGDIDLVWGSEGTSSSDGYGLAKLVKYHPEVISNLQNIISGLSKDNKTSTNRRIQLESQDHKAAVRLEWNGEQKAWLLTAFEKNKDGDSTLTDTADIDGKDDTARFPSIPVENIDQSQEMSSKTALVTLTSIINGNDDALDLIELLNKIDTASQALIDVTR